MQITDIDVRLMPDNGRFKAYCTVTLDDQFVVKDVKIIDGRTGLFVAMPSRKLSDPCGRCRSRNHLLARFCNECGARLPETRIQRGAKGKPVFDLDIVHPITASCRQRFERQILEAYNQELEASRQTGYQPRFNEPATSQPESPE